MTAPDTLVDFHTARDARLQGTDDRHLRRQHGLVDQNLVRRKIGRGGGSVDATALVEDVARACVEIKI